MSVGADFNWLTKQAKDRKSKQKISEIKKWHGLAYGGNFSNSQALFPVNLGMYEIWLRESGAYSSVDIYTEIFKDNGHLDLDDFSGKNAGTIIDLGANEGYYTLKIKQNNPDCRIIAVEPNPLPFELLRKNVESNKLSMVDLENKAISANSGNIELEIFEHSSAIGGKDMEIMERPWLKKELIRKIDVECVTLEEIFTKYALKKVDIMKIDIEGMELEVLEGGRAFLPYVERVVVEWHSQKLRGRLKDFMKENGFKLVFEKEAVCGDLYFVNMKL